MSFNVFSQDDQVKNFRHEFETRTDKKKDMHIGTYIIVGNFGSEINAKHMSSELKKMGYKEVRYGHLKTKNRWYINIPTSNDLEIAKAEADKYRSVKLFKDAWLLTVHNNTN